MDGVSTVKPRVLVTAAVALAAALVRMGGAEPLADLIATGYLVVATVACAPSWTPSQGGLKALRSDQ